MDADWYLFGRVALAALLGALIGWEREARGHAAGDRTFAMLAIGAAAFTAVVAESDDATALSRVVQGVSAGIGFIGAALTWRTGNDRSDVRGLTTAAAVWAVVAIGILCGVGKLLLSTLVAALVLVVLELRHIPVLKWADAARVSERYNDEDVRPQ